MTIPEAYAACERLASGHYENFPVASHLLPRGMRPHIAAIYAFARAADDFADEGDRADAERHRLLDDWLARLRACVTDAGLASPSGGPGSPARDVASLPRSPGSSDPVTGIASPDPHAVFLALGETMRARALPLSLFEDLLSAFRQDITTHRYASWEAVLDYCRRSANPVGRLVLRVAGFTDPVMDEASDALCTALQLTNFWQDLAVDWARGRLYAPRDDCERFGATEADLDRGVITPAWRALLAEMSARTSALFTRGRPVCDGVPGRLGYELRLTWLGGRRVLERLALADFDVFRSRPALGAGDVPILLWRASTWRLAHPA